MNQSHQPLSADQPSDAGSPDSTPESRTQVPESSRESTLAEGVLDIPPLSASQTLAATFVSGTHVPPSPDLSNCLLGEFRLLRRLGSGGMAQVYLANQTSLQRNVAIKVMRPDFGMDETLQRRFEQEARAAAGLNHPNIVQVYAVGEFEGLRFIAQEYVQGQNLKQLLQKKQPPDAKLAIHLLRQVCSALQAAHKAGIVHRDIKPENIMVTRRMVAKVTDFGLAQLTLGGERVNLTQQNMTMGTPLYMSPEQVSGATVDPRSDLYSLGVTFFHLLAGEPPFRAESVFALAYKHLNEAPPSLASRRPDLPRSLVALVRRLMAKKPEDRFEDARAVLAELKRIDTSDESEADWASDDADVPEGTVTAGAGFAWKPYLTAGVVIIIGSIVLGLQARPPNPLQVPAPASSPSGPGTPSAAPVMPPNSAP